VICALLGISGCLKQEELSQTAFPTQPIGMEAKPAVALVLREESILESCRAWGPRPHICVYSHGEFSGYTFKSHLETEHQLCCHNPPWAVSSQGTGRILFHTQVAQCLLLHTGTNQCSTWTSYNLSLSHHFL
jgi:hypothetical protein